MSAERDRVERDYARYSQSARKRRAWDAANAGNRAIRAELTAALHDVLTERTRPFLDVGCGTGWWLRELRDSGCDVSLLHGIDVQPERVAAAAETLPGADIRAGDARALPYADGEFGAVTLLTTLSSLADDASVATALAEAKRVTAPGGVIAVYEPRLPNPFNRRTLTIRRAQIEDGLGLSLAERPLTVLPLFARAVPAAYPLFARVLRLNSHRLVWAKLPY